MAERGSWRALDLGGWPSSRQSYLVSYCKLGNELSELAGLTWALGHHELRRGGQVVVVVELNVGREI